MKIASAPIAYHLMSLWLQSPAHAWSGVRPVGVPLGKSVVSFSSTRQCASLADEFSVKIDEDPTGKLIDLSVGTSVAKGTVASFFPGGLSAIRIADDDLIKLDGNSPSMVGAGVPGQTTENTSDDVLGHKVLFADGSSGVVVAHRAPVVYVYDGRDSVECPEGEVEILKDMATVSVPELSAVVDWNGQLQDASWNGVLSRDDSPAKKAMQRAIFAPIPKVADVSLINEPMLTGVSMIDALAPIGKGQNMLMVGHDKDEMRRYALDFIRTQLREDETKIVYAAIDGGEKTVEDLRAANVLDSIHVVAAKRSNGSGDDVAKAAEATTVAATACAIAEAYALEEKRDALVIVDSIDEHKNLWDATTRVLVEFFGAESVVKADREGGASSEMRSFYSSLIQRAGRFKEEKGGGSVTLLLLTSIPKLSNEDEEAMTFSESDFDFSGEKVKERITLLLKRNIPLTAANLRKINIPIPSVSEGSRRLALQHVDDLISMSDGQIWLDELLENQGNRPPLDPSRSVTRVGIGADTESRADAPALQRVAEGLRLALSQAASMDGAEDTIASKKQIIKSKALLLAMHQESGKGGRTLAESTVLLFAANSGVLDEFVEDGASPGSEKGDRVVSELLLHLRSQVPNAMEKIETTLDFEDTVQEEVKSAFESFQPALT